ncbi:MAG: SDR family NAD(P)-dependent oxidoreductase [Desulfomonilaceae bacterium]
MSIKGKTVVVTGGAKGIGRAIGLRLARDGANVGILDIDYGLASKTVKEIEALNVRAMAVECDVTDYANVKAAVETIQKEFGSVDILINNAGIDKSQFFVETNEAVWDRFISVNYKSFLNATHACLPYMIEQKSGVIVSLGSDAGRVGNSGEVVYCGTKAAIMASSKALARELARFNIRVNSVSPGPVQTDLLSGLHEGEKGQKIMEAVARMIPLKRLGLPEDVADVVAFLASDDARYMTGQVLSVDGGLTMIG